MSSLQRYVHLRPPRWMFLFSTSINISALQVKKYIEHNHYEYPCIIGRSIDGHFRLLLTDYDISTVADNHAKFLELLKTRFQQNNLPWDSVVTENFVKS